VSRPVEIRHHKHPATLHWQIRAQWLADDEWGTWLAGPVPTALRKGHEVWWEYPVPFVSLIPPGEWWMAMFNVTTPERAVEVYVDIVTPARWEGDGLVHFIDLDLDVVRLADGHSYIDDEDEFLEHQRSLAYPAEWIDNVRRTADELLPLVRDRVEPFGAVAAARLRSVQLGDQ
jgi:hypothetical protein